MNDVQNEHTSIDRSPALHVRYFNIMPYFINSNLSLVR